MKYIRSDPPPVYPLSPPEPRKAVLPGSDSSRTHVTARISSSYQAEAGPYAMDVIHTAIAVSDLDATLDFYVDGLGLARSNEFEIDGVRNVYVAGEDGTEIQFKFDPASTEPVEPAGIDHLAVSVDDVDAEFDRLREATDCPVQVEPTDIPEANARVAFVEDPEGYVVELVEYL